MASNCFQPGRVPAWVKQYLSKMLPKTKAVKACSVVGCFVVLWRKRNLFSWGVRTVLSAQWHVLFPSPPTHTHGLSDSEGYESESQTKYSLAKISRAMVVSNRGQKGRFLFMNPLFHIFHFCTQTSRKQSCSSVVTGQKCATKTWTHTGLTFMSYPLHFNTNPIGGKWSKRTRVQNSVSWTLGLQTLDIPWAGLLITHLFSSWAGLLITHLFSSIFWRFRAFSSSVRMYSFLIPISKHFRNRHRLQNLRFEMSILHFSS